MAAPSDPGDSRPAPSYMPGRRGPQSFRSTHGAALYMVVGAVFVLVVLSLWSLAVTARHHPDRVNFGPRVFTVGRAETLASTVDAHGPLLFQDLITDDDRELDVYVQHLSGPAWTTFQAFAPGSERTCQLRWQAATHTFADPCSEGTTYPADGKGLPHYQTTIDDNGRLVVDFNTPLGTSP